MLMRQTASSSLCLIIFIQCLTVELVTIKIVAHFSTFSRVGLSSFPLLKSTPFQSLLCSFYYLFCSWLSASSNGHRWLKRTIEKGDAVDWSQNVIMSSPGLRSASRPRVQQPRDSVRDTLLPSFMAVSCPCSPKTRPEHDHHCSFTLKNITTTQIFHVISTMQLQKHLNIFSRYVFAPLQTVIHLKEEVIFFCVW